MIFVFICVMRRIPYYLSLLDPAMDFNANTDNLFFRKRAELWDEFDHFYQTLFYEKPLSRTLTSRIYSPNITLI